MKVTVVGSGFVGQTTAMRILEKDLAEVCLIDIIEGKPQGLALDLRQAAPIEGYEPSIVGTNDYADTAGSDIVVITAGFPRQPGMSRMDLLGKNAAIMRDVVDKATPGSPGAIVIVVSNPLDEMTFLAAEASGFPRERVMGMAGVLDSARLRSFIAEELSTSPSAVEAITLGSHGDAMVAAIARDTKEVLPVCAWTTGQYGISDVYVGVPARLGAAGVEEIVELDLNDEELARLREAAEGIRAKCADLAR